VSQLYTANMSVTSSSRAEFGIVLDTFPSYKSNNWPDVLSLPPILERMYLSSLRARRLPAQLIIYILGIWQYLWRQRRVCVIIVVVVIVVIALVAIIFLFSFPSGENDGKFYGSLPVGTTGVESPCDFKDFWSYLLKISPGILFGTYLQCRH